MVFVLLQNINEQNNFDAKPDPDVLSRLKLYHGLN